LCKRFRSSPVAVKGFSLHPNSFGGCANLCVSQRLYHRSRRTAFLCSPFNVAFGFNGDACGVNPASPRKLRYRDWRHRPPNPRPGPIGYSIVSEHRVATRLGNRHNLSGFCVRNIEAGESPMHVVCTKRTTRGNLNEHAPYPVIRVLMPDRSQRQDSHS
jgi:hypothetical protein